MKSESKKKLPIYRMNSFIPFSLMNFIFSGWPVQQQPLQSARGKANN